VQCCSASTSPAWAFRLLEGEVRVSRLPSMGAHSSCTASAPGAVPGIERLPVPRRTHDGERVATRPTSLVLVPRCIPRLARDARLPHSHGAVCRAHGRTCGAWTPSPFTGWTRRLAAALLGMAASWP
jgi:hypothetical protein